MPEMKTVWQIWRIVGDPDKTIWATKEDAERWARIIYPNEPPKKRYARIYYDNVESFDTDHELAWVRSKQ